MTFIPDGWWNRKIASQFGWNDENSEEDLEFCRKKNHCIVLFGVAYALIGKKKMVCVCMEEFFGMNAA